ncbi:D-alanyl-D-alanine carboxypeptidase [Novosphingobium marinum]|uniref:serine-type D-Ala-D-Ala carboxypeptidase n=1 Tax=Novosphingobium marinum TaxID=1514948 RepID=A0A7Y9XVV8_9SPHN|nr:D-alanyl-D-alanine carboxypeptidase family protein [Novosphingobium marinum]NYH94253.1 D-alanyl-D-alanine carboxypeptidase (penicillin-binding protein 5/6) [Novosphingobium marinum]GGC20895.1 D-alanyl-D-alanine carboxypeptidase [Novosphingobium marinum]
MSRILIASIAGLLLAGDAIAALPAPPPEIEDVPVVLLVDLGSGQQLIARQENLSFVPASMTKVMTAYVAFGALASGRLGADRTYTVGEGTSREWSGKGTSLYLRPGQEVSVDTLLRGIMTVSANDASVVLAEEYAGSVPVWTAMMNGEARRLGMTKSSFNTPNGWPDEGKTFVSARDLVRLASAMIRQYPDLYSRYVGKKRMTFEGVTRQSHDPTIEVVEGADGIKTGYTREAGYNFLGSAQRGQRRLVMVVAGNKTGAQRAEAARALIEWGFTQWRARPLFAAGKTVATARVQGGESRSVPLAATAPVYAVVPVSGGEKIRLRVRYDGPLEAPVRKGQRVGSLEIVVDNLPDGRVPLVAAKPVGEAGPLDRIMNGLYGLFS